MHGVKIERLSVPGAELYHEFRGSGPVVLISQSGEDDARQIDELVDHLIDHYTVVTYDRRGLSRSTLDDPARPTTIDTHADDIHRLLTALTANPAIVVGCGLGAIVGLHLVLRHPGQVSTLIAHEPIALGVLSERERDDAERELDDVQDLFEQQGWAAAAKRIPAILGIDPHNQDIEPGTQEPIDNYRAANLEYLFSNDITAARCSSLEVADVVALKAGSTRIIPAVGRATPRSGFSYRCAEELSAILGVKLETFPGSHPVQKTDPRAFAARLREVLANLA